MVSDPTGAVVPGAQVTVVNVGTNATYKTATNQAGNFTLRTIPVGNYKLMVEASGFICATSGHTAPAAPTAPAEAVAM